jgi:hypothetical protein
MIARKPATRDAGPRRAHVEERVQAGSIAHGSLRSGDVVQVRSAAEILATLDENGTLGGMPFMPEMLRFAGTTVPVYKRADKTCDTTHATGLRRLEDTVLLDGARCDGSAHGGCQAGCLLFWNERWLRRAAGGDADTRAQRSGGGSVPAGADGDPSAAGQGGAIGAPETVPAGCVTAADLDRLTRQADGEDGSPRYACQATELFSASTALPWWEPTQYLRDIWTGNATIRQVLVGIARWLSVRIQWRVNRSGVPFVKGRLATTPRRLLDLEPGERVRIKSRREIEATLDTNNRNRGLQVDADMMLFCGREFRVLRRINRIVDERSRKLIEIPGDCIVLDGATCTGAYNRCCPRSDYPYWREIWLSRVEEGSHDQAAQPDQASPAGPATPRDQAAPTRG